MYGPEEAGGVTPPETQQFIPPRIAKNPTHRSKCSPHLLPRIRLGASSRAWVAILQNSYNMRDAERFQGGDVR